MKILPAMSNMAQQVFQKMIKKRTKKLGILLDELFWFRKPHSTEHQALWMAQYIYEGFQPNMVTDIICLDVSESTPRTPGPKDNPMKDSWFKL